MRKGILALCAAAMTLAIGAPAYATHRDGRDRERDYRRHYHYRFYNFHDGYRTWTAPQTRVPRPISFGVGWAAPWLNGLHPSAAPYFDYEKNDSGFLLF